MSISLYCSVWWKLETDHPELWLYSTIFQLISNQTEYMKEIGGNRREAGGMGRIREKEEGRGSGRGGGMWGKDKNEILIEWN